MKIGCIMWNSHMPTFARAGATVPEIGLRLVSLSDMEDEAKREEFFAWAERGSGHAVGLLHTGSNGSGLGGARAEVR